MIDCYDIIRAYVRNYHKFDISYYDTATKVTRKIIQFFSALGEQLGYFVAIEAFDRQDLVWVKSRDFKAEKKKKWVMHMELENVKEAERNLTKTFPRLKSTRARIKVAIMKVHYSNKPRQD